MAPPRAKDAAKRKAKTRRPPTARRSKAAAPARGRPRSTPARVLKRAAEKAAETLQASGPTGERVRPSHWRYCRAKLRLVERGIGPTVVAIAKELGIHRVTLYKFLARYPWLDAWVDGLARAAAVHQYGQILLRHGHLAIQGSVQSADLVFKAEGGYYTRNGFGDGDSPNGGGQVVVQINSLVPRPDYAGALAAQQVQALPADPVPKIPVINIR